MEPKLPMYVVAFRRGDELTLEPDSEPGWEPVTLKLDSRVYVWRGPDDRLRLYHRELPDGLDAAEALQRGWARQVAERE